MSKLKNLILAAMAVLTFSSANAEYVTPAQALARLDNSSVRPAMVRSRVSAELKPAATIGGLYVFDSADGFMILPNDDRASALLAFSDDERFDIMGNPALAEWLEFYNRQLEYLRSNPQIQKAKAQTVARRAARAEIAPLIKTEWNQESPYNMLCPKVNGHDVVTGCVATAMAQFMKYYEYPPKGKGTHSYYWEPGNETLALDYDTIPFQWDLMTDTYNKDSSEAAKKAVAGLMVACGISVDMHYDIGDSGAATTHMGVSLIDIFDYSPSLWMAHRDYYGYDEWIGMVYDELAKGQPVLYSGQGTAGGHQFICDGFKGDGYFHFNWGWGGLSNGYFLLTALNPDDLGVGGGAGGFNTDQIITLSARPAQTGDEPTYLMYNGGSFTPFATEVKAGDEFQCDGTYFNYSMSELPEGSTLGMKFTNADTKAAEFVRGPSVAGLKLDEGRYYDYVKFPYLADGTYYITPALHAGGKWSEVRMPLGSPNRITAVVADSVATFTDESAATITISDIKMPEKVYALHDFPLEFTGYNASDLEYYANVTPYMLDSVGTAVATSDYRPMDVLPDASEVVNDYVANFAALTGQTFDAGDYSLVFRDSSGKNISEPITVHVDTTSVATAITITDFKIVTPSPIPDPSKIEFSFRLTCDAGVYYDCPTILIFPGDGGYDEASVSGDKHYLSAGESADITLTGNLDNLKDGWYMAGVYADGKAKTDYPRFEIQRIVSGLKASAEDEQTTPATIYNLQGIRCTPPLSPGLYIINGQAVLIK